MDPATKPMWQEMHQADGSLNVCERVWISSLGTSEKEQVGKLTTGFGADQRGPKIGPEFTFGIYMEKSTDAPILLIKTSWGGKSLHTDFRPPSAGPYVFEPTQLVQWKTQGKDVDALLAEKKQQTGVFYRMMIEHVKSVLKNPLPVVPGYDAKEGYELSGFVWLQGWNDLVDGGAYPQRDKPGGYDAYSSAMAHFIRDVRKDLAAPKLPFVIGVLGVGGPTEKYGPEQQRYKVIHQQFRDAMAAPANLPEFKGNVVAVRTEQFWDAELQAAINKDNVIKREADQAAKQQKLAPVDAKKLLEQKRLAGLNERERSILEKGISNFEFHYLGSAKILGGIGKGFAEAMIELNAKK
jgi:alpha-galactosidase